MSKVRRLAVAGAAFALAVAVPSGARGQVTSDSRSLFLAAVGSVTPDLFTSLFAFSRSYHAAPRGRGVAASDMAPGLSYSVARGGLLNDQGAGERGLIGPVSAFFVTFDPATRTFDNASLELASLLSGNSNAGNIFLIFAQPGRRGTQFEGDDVGITVPSFANLPGQAGSAGGNLNFSDGEVELKAPAAPGAPGALVAVTTTPEPASLALMATGLIGVAGWTRRRKAKVAD